MTEFEIAKNPNTRCPECHGLRGGHSNRRCSLMSLEYAQEEIINVEQRWIRLLSDQHSNYQKVIAVLKKKVVFFQGKFAMVKHENNKLRNKSREGSRP